MELTILYFADTSKIFGINVADSFKGVVDIWSVGRLIENSTLAGTDDPSPAMLPQYLVSPGYSSLSTCSLEKRTLPFTAPRVRLRIIRRGLPCIGSVLRARRPAFQRNALPRWSRIARTCCGKRSCKVLGRLIAGARLESESASQHPAHALRHHSRATELALEGLVWQHRAR